MSKKICYNCKHAGEPFKLPLSTPKVHVHCEHSSYKEQHKAGNTPSPWETLREFWATCDLFEQNLKP